MSTVDPVKVTRSLLQEYISNIETLALELGSLSKNLTQENINKKSYSYHKKNYNKYEIIVSQLCDKIYKFDDYLLEAKHRIAIEFLEKFNNIIDNNNILNTLLLYYVD